MKTLEAGQTFAEKYRVVRCIASGGMGAVYEVVHEETQRTLALKVLLPTFLDRPELRDRFRTEARITAPIQSDAIVQVYDAGVEPESGMPYMAMELLRGEPLDHKVCREGHLSPGVVCACLMQLALALDKTHAAQIVHRDLKPENLFLTRKEDGTEQLKILDFGLAKMVEENAARTPHTSSVGTPLYMAPEQFHSGEISSATDVYALGMLAFTLLVGVPYWDNEAHEHRTLVAFAMAVAAGPTEPASVRATRAGVGLPPEFDAWFARMTAVDPAKRPPQATAAIQDLADLYDVILPAGLSSSGVMSSSGIDQAIARSSPSASSGRHATAMSATVAGPSVSPRPMRSRIALLAGLAAAALLAAASWLWTSRTSSPAADPSTPAAPSVSFVTLPVAASLPAASLSAETPPSAWPAASDAATPDATSTVAAIASSAHPVHPAVPTTSTPAARTTPSQPSPPASRSPLYTRE